MTEALLRGMLYLGRKKEAVGAPLGNANKSRKNQLPQSEAIDSDKSTAGTVAKETRVSKATVERDAKFAKAAEKLGIAKDILAGNEKRSKAAIIQAAEPDKPAPQAAANPERPGFQNRLAPGRRRWQFSRVGAFTSIRIRKPE